MMKRTLTALLALALVFSLAACGSADDTETTPTPTASAEPEETSAPSAEPEETVPTVEAGALTFGEAGEDALSEYESYESFTVDEGGTQLLFLSSEDVTNFTFFTLAGNGTDDGTDVSSDSGTDAADATDETAADATDGAESDTTDGTDGDAADDTESDAAAGTDGDAADGAEPVYAAGETLYSLDTLDADTPVVITVNIPEGDAVYGFSYTDSDGVVHSYAVTLNTDTASDAAPYVATEF